MVDLRARAGAQPKDCERQAGQRAARVCWPGLRYEDDRPDALVASFRTRS